MSALNDAIPPLVEALAALRAQRYDAYYGIDGLKTKFSGMKQSIKGQYTPPAPSGRRSRASSGRGGGMFSAWQFARHECTLNGKPSAPCNPLIP